MVIKVLRMQEKVIARILARITDGESRDRFGDGLVALLR
jgi:hypothetical protein